MIRLSHWIRTASEKWHERSGRDPSVRPVDGYPSSIVDSQGCEFESELYYHIGYAYHLHRHGLLKRTISCIDTECFYWFSPQHIERYGHRKPVTFFASIDQIPGESPALNRWNFPDYRAHYQTRLNFGFDRMILPIFNATVRKEQGISVGSFSRQCITNLTNRLQGRFQVVYFGSERPVAKPTEDSRHLDEEDALRSAGVVMGDELFHAISQTDSGVTYNTFQLTLLAQSPIRISSHTHSSFTNALFPGQLFLLCPHRSGDFVDTVTHLQRTIGSTITMVSDELILLHRLMDYLDGGSHASKLAA